MAQGCRIEVVDGNGWRKSFPIQKKLVYVGSAPENDVVLAHGRGGGISPRHIQLISLAEGSSSYRLVNLGGTAISLGASGDRTLSPNSYVDVQDGEQIKLGDFTLIFHDSSGPSTSDPLDLVLSDVIGLEIVLPRTQITPNSALEGNIVVGNRGDQKAVQFELELEGLDSEHYMLGPGPILFPDVDKEVPFCLYHRGDKPVSGRYRIVIRASAPKAYPHEYATASTVVHFLPFYSHEINFLSPDIQVPQMGDDAKDLSEGEPGWVPIAQPQGGG